MDRTGFHGAIIATIWFSPALYPYAAFWERVLYKSLAGAYLRPGALVFYTQCVVVGN